MNPTFYIEEVLGESRTGKHIANAVKEFYPGWLIGGELATYIIFDGQVLDMNGTIAYPNLAELVESLNPKKSARVILGSRQDCERLRDAVGTSIKWKRQESFHNHNRTVIYSLSNSVQNQTPL
jgi:hypothetical protein